MYKYIYIYIYIEYTHTVGMSTREYTRAAFLRPECHQPTAREGRQRRVHAGGRGAVGPGGLGRLAMYVGLLAIS